MSEDPRDSILKGLLKSILPPPSPSGQPGKLLRLPRPEPDYGDALDRSARSLLQRQVVLDRERAESRSLVPELLAHGPARQPLLVRNRACFHTWGVLERLLERSRAEMLDDSRESERLAKLALAQSDHLDASYYGPARVEDMRARAWSMVAEARRRRSDFAGADEAFAEARSHLQSGTGDSLEWAFVLDSEAALRCCQRRFARARELLSQALATFVENGEDQRAGSSLIRLATVRREEGQPARAISLLHEALRRIDGEREPRLLLTAQHVLAESLVAAGRIMEARGVLIRTRPLYRRHADAWTQSHLRWLRGRVALGLGQSAEAEAELLGARSAFFAAGAPFEAGLVALDLAGLYARQKRAADLKPLAAEAAGFFKSCGVEREALSADAFLRQAEEFEPDHRELAHAVGAFGE
jgi:tetratricopeptide (TPR) repeat protein